MSGHTTLDADERLKKSAGHLGAAEGHLHTALIYSASVQPSATRDLVEEHIEAAIAALKKVKP